MRRPGAGRQRRGAGRRRVSAPAIGPAVPTRKLPPMSQNLIDLELSPEALTAIDAALTTLETHLSPLRGLDPESRRGLTKMGDKSEAFCRRAVVAFAQNTEVLPRNFDQPSYLRDLAALDSLRPRLQRLSRVQEMMEDTEMALGSDLMTRSLEGYAVLKVAGKGTGLDGLRQMLSARFNRGRRAETVVAAEPA